MLLAKKFAAWLAVALFAAATAVALLQPVHPDPFEPKVGLDRFLFPTETNAFTRLPSIGADLNDLHVEVGEDGQTKLWAVADGGAILHSPDGGQCWEAQGPWAPKGVQAACGPRNLWDQMELIPAALAAKDAQPRMGVSTEEPPSEVRASQTANLRPGIRDPEVPALRELLQALGYDTGVAPADPGLFDEELAGVVKEFQRSSGIAADGYVGPKTRELLDDRLARQEAVQIGSNREERADAGVSGQQPELPLVASPVARPPDLRAVFFIDAQTGWAVGGGGTILKTVDGGASWSAQASGTQARLYAVQILETGTGWAVGDDGTILKTVDGGASWSAQAGGTRARLYAVQMGSAHETEKIAR